MINVWTLIVLVVHSQSEQKIENIFLSKEECVRVGRIFPKQFENSQTYVKTFCYESTRIDTK